uniref:uncharacterized protein n=1 Tax=Myxine glutinosa TaxID=7769 RepID=UPI00358EB7FD
MEKVSTGDGSPTLVSVSSDISEDSACCCPPATPSPTRLRSYDDGYDSDDSSSSLGRDRPSPFQRNTRARRAVSRWRRPSRPIVTAQSMPLLSETSASPKTEDWTERLFCGRRTRRPLVLGDNSLADLVGQWMQPPDKSVAAQIDAPRPQARISKYFNALSEWIRQIPRSRPNNDNAPSTRRPRPVSIFDLDEMARQQSKNFRHVVWPVKSSSNSLSDDSEASSADIISCVLRQPCFILPHADDVMTVAIFRGVDLLPRLRFVCAATPLKQAARPQVAKEGCRGVTMGTFNYPLVIPHVLSLLTVYANSLGSISNPADTSRV